jgi:hypothetical protein
LITAVRRAKIQNDVSYVLEHMTKQISRAIGNGSSIPVTIGSDTASDYIAVWIDADYDGILNPSSDARINYTYVKVSTPPYSPHMILYRENDTAGWEILGSHFTYFQRELHDNYAVVKVDACWDTTNLTSCGQSENPFVSMTSSIKMPSVSLR